MSGHPRFLLVILAVGALFVGACGDSDKKPSSGGSNTPAGTTVAVALQEWSVVPLPTSAPGGSVTFQATNKSTMMKHELVVVKTSLAPGSLPTKADGSVDEAGAGITAVGKIEALDIGKSGNATFTLATGAYVLFCNVLENPPTANMGGIGSHYKLGMRIGFTVT